MIPNEQLHDLQQYRQEPQKKYDHKISRSLVTDDTCTASDRYAYGIVKGRDLYIALGSVQYL